MSATGASATGWRVPATGRSAATGSGAHPCRCGVRTTPACPRLDVYGSLDEIERDFGVRPDDLHRPFVDSLTRPNPDDPSGRSVMRRVPEVLDCWFESGSMPYAQVHYPFENKEWFERHFPADFIVEYVNQTRGWFYTLHVLATALFDRPPFRNALCHGVVLAHDGAKLSKRLRNYTDPEVIFARQGADALRWYLMASPVLRGGDLRISDEGIDAVVRGVLHPLWNAYAFFTMYANADGTTGRFDTGSSDVLDRYVLAKTRELVLDPSPTVSTPTTCPVPAPRWKGSSEQSTTGTSAAAVIASGRRPPRRTRRTSRPPTTRCTRCSRPSSR